MRRRGAMALTLLALLGVCVFTALGIWQLERREWKLALIADVERGANSEPILAPDSAKWGYLQAYQKVFVTGRWIKGKDVHVLAVTSLGRGYWVISPLETEQGFIVLINRGFIPEALQKSQDFKPLSNDAVTITGLLRLSEPPHGFLRENDPINDRWYSRNIDGIARSRNMADVAPYFIDADKGLDTQSYPIGGMTILTFRNNHLGYAFTWFCLAFGLAGSVIYVRLSDRLKGYVHRPS